MNDLVDIRAASFSESLCETTADSENESNLASSKDTPSKSSIIVTHRTPDGKRVLTVVTPNKQNTPTKSRVAPADLVEIPAEIVAIEVEKEVEKEADKSPPIKIADAKMSLSPTVSQPLNKPVTRSATKKPNSSEGSCMQPKSPSIYLNLDASIERNSDAEEAKNSDEKQKKDDSDVSDKFFSDNDSQHLAPVKQAARCSRESIIIEHTESDVIEVDSQEDQSEDTLMDEQAVQENFDIQNAQSKTNPSPENDDDDEDESFESCTETHEVVPVNVKEKSFSSDKGKTLAREPPIEVGFFEYFNEHFCTDNNQDTRNDKEITESCHKLMHEWVLDAFEF